jgi:hypothetical protein
VKTAANYTNSAYSKFARKLKEKKNGTTQSYPCKRFSHVTSFFVLGGGFKNSLREFHCILKKHIYFNWLSIHFECDRRMDM